MNSKGFTLLEIMIALTISLFLLAGASFVFLSMKFSSENTTSLGDIQESGRITMDILSRDIKQAGFWGSYHSSTLNPLYIKSPANPINDCLIDQTGSFPNPAKTTFRYIYSQEIAQQGAIQCIDNAMVGSDMLQIKRVAGLEIDDASNNKDAYLFISQTMQGEFVMPPASGKVTVPHANASVWPYRHHIYYIAHQDLELNGKKLSIPSLERKRLTASQGMITETVMEGVENLRFIFGLDTTSNNQVDTYKTQQQLTDLEWDQSTAKILTVQIFLLVRSIEQNKNQPVTAQSFTLGGTDPATQRILSFNDNYRRRLFVSTVNITNSEDDSWRL